MARTPKVRNPNPPRGMRWESDEWRRIKQAAAKVAAREERRVPASEIIRKGTARYVNEIMGAA